MTSPTSSHTKKLSSLLLCKDNMKTNKLVFNAVEDTYWTPILKSRELFPTNQFIFVQTLFLLLQCRADHWHWPFLILKMAETPSAAFSRFYINAKANSITEWSSYRVSSFNTRYTYWPWLTGLLIYQIEPLIYFTSLLFHLFQGFTHCLVNDW